MKPNEGMLQTAEHILVRIIMDRADVAVGIAKFEEDQGTVEFVSQEDLRLLDMEELEGEVSKVIRKNIRVKKYFLSREKAAEVVSLSKIPADVKEVRIVDIEGFYASACKEQHVDSTGEIGAFKITGVGRVGKDRYRFTFRAGMRGRAEKTE